MYSTLLSVVLCSALAIQGALAEFNVNTPKEITVCDPLKITWDQVDGAKSYNVALVATENPCESVVAELGDHKGTSMTWNPVGLKVGQSLMISVLADDDVDEGWSGAITVSAGDCTKSSSAAPSSSSSSSSSSSEAASASAKPGTTLVVNPAAAPTSTTGAPVAPPAPSSTDSAQAVGAANAGILGGDNGAFASVQFSASTLAFSAVFAVAALAF